MNKTVFLFILLTGIVLLYYIKTNPDRKNMAFLNEYGWDINRTGFYNKKGTRESVDTMMNIMKMQSNFENMKTELSKIGIRLDEEELDKVKIYRYYLEQYGIDEPLIAHVWVAKGKVVFSYIYNLDQHTKLTYWPINYDYEEIRIEIFRSREKVLESYN